MTSDMQLTAICLAGTLESYTIRNVYAQQTEKTK